MSEARPFVLIVEDERRLASVLADYLAATGFETEWIADGREAVPAVRRRTPDLVLLDLMLPGTDGLDVCRELRSFSNVPIIMVTARAEEVDRLIGLELGADDYICKPFSPREVVARVRAILRRVDRDRPEPTVPGLSIDTARHVAAWKGHELDLTAVEFRLLCALAETPGRVWSRSQLVDRLYTDGRVVTDRTVDSHIKNLRRKLARAGAGEELIRSIYGVGYKVET
jgi:two-component system response regulator BaeR